MNKKINIVFLMDVFRGITGGAEYQLYGLLKRIDKERIDRVYR